MDNSKPEIEIARLSSTHMPMVMKIEKSVFRDPWTAGSFVEIMAFSEECWAALSEGRVAGYLITQWVLDEIHILNLAVDRHFFRKGIGSRLLGFILKRGASRGMQDVFLEVRVSNAAAIALYLRFGFEQLSVRKRYYNDGEDAFVMHCRLAGVGVDSPSGAVGSGDSKEN
jgi:[ribosomal protein S18]-alanine N-acetyltransferase